MAGGTVFISSLLVSVTTPFILKGGCGLFQFFICACRVQTEFLFETFMHVFISNKLETKRQLM